jgi:hypothetical protein
MHWLATGRAPIDQTARIRAVIRIALDYFTVKNADEHLVE